MIAVAFVKGTLREVECSRFFNNRTIILLFEKRLLSVRSAKYASIRNHLIIPNQSELRARIFDVYITLVYL